MIKFSYHIKKDSLLLNILGLITSIFIFLIRFPFLFRKNYSSKVLVIALHKLGDTVFTVPAIKALRNKFGKDLTIVCYEDSRKIYEIAFNDLNFLILKKEDFYFSGRIAKAALRKKVNALGVGTIIDLTGAINSASLIFNNKATKIVGFNEKYFKEIYSNYISVRKIPHQMDIYLDAVKLAMNIKDEESLKYFGKSLNSNGEILIHPFAGWKTKEWSFKKFIDLYFYINKFHSCKFIIPIERTSEEILFELQTKKITFIVTKDITELIDEIKKASILIGCDSGAVNIASLLGKPTFIIYGPTNPMFHLPYGDHHEYIYKESAISPKINEKYGAEDAGRKNPELDFMGSISVEEVYSRVTSFYKKIFEKDFEKIQV